MAQLRQAGVQPPAQPDPWSTAAAVTGVGQNNNSNVKGKPIFSPIDWPNDYIHGAGVPEISFDRLSLSEFVCGSVRIIETAGITEEEKLAGLIHNYG